MITCIVVFIIFMILAGLGNESHYESLKDSGQCWCVRQMADDGAYFECSPCNPECIPCKKYHGNNI